MITGDITQVDLPHEKPSGLIESKEILKGIDGIKFVFFSERDVVRHKLVQEIIRAYDRRDRIKKKGHTVSAPETNGPDNETETD